MEFMAILDRVFKQDFRLSRGSASLISRQDNVLSAIENRFSVFFRSIPFRPVYGGGLKEYSNRPMTKALAHKVVQHIREQIGRERRVRDIRRISINTQDDGSMRIEVDVLILGQQDSSQFQVVI